MSIELLGLAAAYVAISYVWGAFTETVAEAKGYSARNWFWGGFCFWIVALIAIAGMPMKAKALSGESE